MKTPENKTIQDAWEKLTPKGQVLKEDFCAIFELASQSKPQEIEWLSSEIKPESDKPVLAIIESGKYPVRVMWVKEHSISTEDWEFHGAEDYNESDDKYYWPEGWYEWNEMEEVHWMCKDVLFWTELPIYDKSELKNC